MSFSKILLKTISVFFTLVVMAFSQGNIRGIIVDAHFGEPLPGANVFIQGTSLGAATDINGLYRITNIPAGSYILEVAYIGYKPKQVPLEVQDKETVTLNIEVEADVIEGETITITAQAEGQIAAINQQVNSNTIVNVVSEEKIQELPDANAAEAIGRLPGVAINRSGGEANKVVMRGLSAKYSTITIDGVRVPSTGSEARDVDLSTISQRSLAGIELFKALTSDMDGDAIAGSINLVTKKAPAERSLRADMRGSYNELDDSYDQYDFSLKYGERFSLFSNDAQELGVQIGGNLEKRIRSNEEYDANTSIIPEDDNPHIVGNDTLPRWSKKPRDFEMQYTDEIRKRQGLSILLDYNTPDDGSIKFNTVFSKTNRDYLEHYRNHPGTADDDLLYTFRNQQQEINTFNTFLKGQNYLLGLDIDWNFSYARSKSETPYDFQLTFREPKLADADGNPISGMANGNVKNPSDLIGLALNNLEQTYLDWAYYRDSGNEETEKSFQFNFSKSYSISSAVSGVLKFGGKYTQRDKTRDAFQSQTPYYLNGYLRKFTRLPDGTIVPKDFSGTIFENLDRSQTDGLNGTGNILFTNFVDEKPKSRNAFDKYYLYPLINKDALKEWYRLNKNGVTEDGGTVEYFENREPELNFYDITETVSANYIMNTLNLGEEITIITGLRIEKEDNDYNSKYTVGSLSGFPVPSNVSIGDTATSNQETIVLPNFHIAYRPADFITVRGAAYKALARPDFNRRLASSTVRTGNSTIGDNSYVIGNPDLKAAKAWNFEIGVSAYDSKFGLFGVSGFYKEIEGMHQLINNLQFLEDFDLRSIIPYDSPFTSRYRVTYPFNSDKLTQTRGIEFELQTHTRFISEIIPGMPGFLNNFVLSGNLTLSRTKTFVPRTRIITERVEILPGIFVEDPSTQYYISEQKLADQPELFGNMSIGYDLGGFSGRVSYFYQDGYNTSFSDLSLSDGVRNEFSRWDIALKQSLTDYLQLFLNVNNVFDETETTSQKNRNKYNKWTVPNTGERYGTTVDLGLIVGL